MGTVEEIPAQCLFPGCMADLNSATQKYCTPAHRKAAHRARHQTVQPVVVVDDYPAEALEVALGLELLSPEELQRLLDRPARRTRRTMWLASTSRSRGRTSSWWR